MTHRVSQELQITTPIKSPWPNRWTKRSSVMGIINITPDSFSDGGQFNTVDKALNQVAKQINEGVDIIDLGAQSTRPGAIEISPEEEIERLIPVLKEIRKNFPLILLSVDTFFSKVAKQSLEVGVDWINDVTSSRRDPDILRVVSDAGCPYVLTHSRGTSENMNQHCSYNDLIIDIENELLKNTEKAINLGIDERNIIWDPGIGFAKNTDQNLTLIRNLHKFNQNKFAVLVGPSRKKFIGDVLNESYMQNRIWGTSAVVCKCVEARIAMVRVHDVGSIVKTIRMAEELWK